MALGCLVSLLYQMFHFREVAFFFDTSFQGLVAWHRPLHLSHATSTHLTSSICWSPILQFKENCFFEQYLNCTEFFRCPPQSKPSPLATRHQLVVTQDLQTPISRATQSANRSQAQPPPCDLSPFMLLGVWERFYWSFASQPAWSP